MFKLQCSLTVLKAEARCTSLMKLARENSNRTSSLNAVLLDEYVPDPFGRDAKGRFAKAFLRRKRILAAKKKKGNENWAKVKDWLIGGLTKRPRWRT